MAAWERELKSARQRQVLGEIDWQIEDVMAAWLWAARHVQVGRLAAALEGLGTYYELRRWYAEGKAAFQAALDGLAGHAEPEVTSLRGWLQAWQARFCRLLGQVEQARELRKVSREALAQADGEEARRGQALLEHEWGYTASDLAEQLEYLQHSAEIFQSLEDPWRQAGVLCWAGEIAIRLGKIDLAFEHLQAAVALSRAVGEPRQLAYALEILATRFLIQGQWEIGAQLMEEAGENFRLAGDPGQEALACLHLGVMKAWTGRFVEASQLLEQALPVLHQVGTRLHITYGTFGLGVCQMHLGEYEQAERTLRSALQAARQDNFARETAFSQAMLGCLDLVQGRPAQGQAELLESVERYRKQSAAGELGMALGGLALAELALEHKEAAQGALQEALRIAVETHSHYTSMTCWAASVTLLAEAGRWEKVLEVYTAGQGLPLLSNSRWQTAMVAPWVDAAIAHLPPEVAEAARKRSQERDQFATAAELLDELRTRPPSQSAAHLSPESPGL
jgi:tetratricopeptide (TPR) repeat protein